LSETSMAQVINYGYYPRTTAPKIIRGQIEQYLRECGVTDAELIGAWEMDEAREEARGSRPPRRPAAPPPAVEPVETEMLSVEARKKFALFRDPFQDDVRGPEHLFLSPDQRYVREALFQVARHGGFVAVVGESGAGKSVLRRDLVDRIAREDLPVQVIQPRSIDKGTLTARAIWEAILDDVRPAERPRATLERLARQVEKILLEQDKSGMRHVLIIEEAHDLSIPTLKYMKRFWEVESGYRKLLSIILIGQPELKLKLSERHTPEAREVIRRCEIVELLPLDGDLQRYVEFKFKAIGREAAEIFDAGAYQAMRERLTQPGRSGDVSMSYPLIVNNLVVRTLNTAADIGAPRITAETVKARDAR